LPKAWPDGSVSGLTARGGIVVDLEWKDGKPTRYQLRSSTPRAVTVRISGKLIQGDFHKP
jgi:alpha-L-fucosidase 2